MKQITSFVLMMLFIGSTVFAQKSATMSKAEMEQFKMEQVALQSPFSQAKTTVVTPSPNVTDEEVIRYDDGTNVDAIGLTAGGTFQVAAYWPASSMGQYAGMKLSQMEIYINDVPTSVVIKIYDAGTTTVPGALLHEETVTVTGLSWNVIELSEQVDISGDDIWIGYEVTHDVGVYAAGCDGGPAVANFGDMISLDGTTFEPMSALGLNYNWNIASTLVDGILYTNDVGVQAINQPVTGPDLSGAEPVMLTLKNYGTASQSNIAWEITWDGPTGADMASGVFAGPLATGATASIDAGTADLSVYGDYTFDACTQLAGDENTDNDCKTKIVTNSLPVYCPATTATEDEFIANVLCGMIDNTSGWQGGVADYTEFYAEIEAGASEAITVTNGNAWASDLVTCWVDWGMDYVFDQGTDEEFVLTSDGTGLTFTGDITVPAGTPDGDYRMRVRMSYSVVPVPCGPLSYGEVEEYTIKVGGGLPPAGPAPENFTAMYEEGTGVNCAWEAPIEPGAWIGYDDGTNNDGLGLQDGGTYWGAITFDPADLTAFDGQYMTMFKFFPILYASEAEITFMIWEGAGQTNLVYEQVLSGLNWNNWNEIMMDEAHMIDASMALSFGFEVTHDAAEYPIGYDDGPAVAGYGDLVSFDGTTWETLSFYGLDYNFNLKGFVANEVDGAIGAKQIIAQNTISNPNAELAIGNFKQFANATDNTVSRAVTGYYIYRDGMQVGNVIPPTTFAYTDAFFTSGVYTYTAKAEYPGGGLSDPTPGVTVTIEGAEISVSPTSVDETHATAPQITTKTLTITNDGIGDLTWEIPTMVAQAPAFNPEAERLLAERIAADPRFNTNTIADVSPMQAPKNTNSTDAQWDVLFTFSAQAPSCQAMATDGINFYMTYWNGTGTFDKFDMDGNFIESFTIAGAAAIRDLAYDGTYFYGAPSGGMSIAQLDLANQTLVSTIAISSTAGVTGSRHLAYDPELDGGNGGFWLGQWAELAAVSMTGATIHANSATPAIASCYGSAYDPYSTPGSPKIWLFTQVAGASANDRIMLEEFDINSLSLTGFTMDLFTLSANMPGFIPGTATAATIAGGAEVYTDANGNAILAVNIQQSPNLVVGLELVAGSQPANDVRISNIVSPNTGMMLGMEDVIVTVQNVGTSTQSNIPFEVTIDGATFYTGSVAGPLANGESVEVDCGTVDMSAVGTTWEFEACTMLVGDANPDNDCKPKSVTHLEAAYCPATTTTEDEYISNVLCGSIDNTSGWQGGVADFTDISTSIDAGASEAITVTNGNAWASDLVTVWVDWNGDYEFEQGGDEEFILTSDGTGLTFTGAIAVPANVPNGEYRMRVRMSYSTAPVPCGPMSYGEVEDYTIAVGGVPQEDWYVFEPLNGVVPQGTSQDITVTFNSAGLTGSLYEDIVTIMSNAVNAPELEVPVSLTVGGDVPTIGVNPMSLAQTHDHVTPTFITTQTLAITNTGGGTLDWNIPMGTNAPYTPVFDPEAERILNERLAADPRFSLETDQSPTTSQNVVNPSDETWDLQLNVDIEAASGAAGNAGAECDGSYYYTTRWASNLIHKYDLDGNLVEEFSIPGVTGLRDLAYDGTYFYGGAAGNSIFQMDFESKTLISTISSGQQVRAIAYDEDNDAFWVSNFGTDVTLVDKSGATLANILNSTLGLVGMYGSAFDSYTDGGPFLWIFDQGAGAGTPQIIYQVDLATLALTGVTYDVLTGLGPDASAIAGGLFIVPDIYTGVASIGGVKQGVPDALFMFELAPTTPPLDNDVLISAISSPNSSMVLGIEDVIVNVKNQGNNAQSNIPFEVTVDGAAFYSGTVAGPLAQGEVAEVNCGTIDLSLVGGEWVFEACTMLAGDNNPDNDCKTKTVTHIPPSYCPATTATEDEFISNVLCGTIDNASGWQGGVADYTDISTVIDAGQSEDITITNGNAWAADIVICWVDWNSDFEWEQGGNEEFLLTNVGGAGASFTGAIAVPANVPNGEYRMRVRMSYSTAPVPCGPLSYGEVEDYTIVVGGVPPVDWLSWTPSAGSLGAGETDDVVVTFNSTQLAAGTYTDIILINSNDLTTPVVSIPVTLVVTNGDVPTIEVDPAEMDFYLDYFGMDTQDLDISNVGGGNLTVGLSITYGQDALAPVSTPIEYNTTINPNQLSLNNTVTPTPSPNVTDDEVIRYDDGINNDAIGLTAGGTFQVAAYWPASSMGQYAGMELTSIEIYINDAPTAAVMKIYDQGSATVPGALLHEQTMSVNALMWNDIVLTSPVTISGNDIWIGYEVTHDVGVYAPGTDAGPAVAGFGDMISLDGVAFEPMSALGLNYNWNIAATLSGNAQVAWLSVDPMSGTIAGGTTETFEVTADATPFGGPSDETFYASIWVASNDPASPMVEVTVELQWPVGMREVYDDAYIMLFPNPTKDVVNISTNYNMSMYKVLNQLGQVVMQADLNSKSVSVNTNQLEAGIYIVKITSEAGESTHKLIVE